MDDVHFFPHINYAKVPALEHGGYTNAQTRLDYALWQVVTPGNTALWLVVAGAYYMWSATRQADACERKRLEGMSRLCLVWGLVHCAVYVVLAQRLKRR